MRITAVQLSMTDNQHDNVEKAIAFIEKAASQDAQIVLLPELFSSPYFCKTKNPAYCDWAESVENSKLLAIFSKLAASLNIVLPISFFERDGDQLYNSVMMIDADGARLGLYRKTHIPRGPGYEEDFYFSPGNTGYKAWKTQHGTLGCGICWDQWFTDAARAMVLQGADVLLYPTAIGSEPQDASLDSKGHWQRVMQGHAAANMVPVIAANRVGVETDAGVEINFYGSSFMTDHTGEIIVSANRVEETLIHTVIDVDKNKKARDGWGLFTKEVL